VSAARSEFAARGYDATSLRAIARAAEVDPALLHHYFDGKAALFAEVMDVPADPRVLIEAVIQGPRERVGEAMVRTFLTIWDSPEGRARFQGVVRSAVTNEDAARMLREFLVREIFGHITRDLTPPGATGLSADPELRAALAAGQMVGVGMMRYVVGFPSVVHASQDELVALLAPTLQHYLAP
jgi:AcrR family transcriptional regulator